MRNLFKKLFSTGATKSTSTVSGITEYQTNLDRSLNHSDIVIRISKKAVIPQDVQIILDYFEKQILAGVQFKSGETLQLGFVLNQFKELDDGRLLLQEPDMVSFPIQYTSSMDFTFITLRNQKDVVESIDRTLDFDFPAITQALMVHKDYKSSHALRLDRSASDGVRSGWWVHTNDDFNPDDYYITSIYQFALDRPDLVKYLALPVGYRVCEIKGKPFKILLNNNEVHFQDGSYLAELNKGP